MADARRWYRIQNLAGGITDVSIFDEIGIMGVTAQDFLSDLPAGRGPLMLHLNSGGGEVFEGLAIYHALRNRGNVTVRVEGVAASIASVIAMAADPGKLEIAKRASMMIHNGFAQQVGDANDMRKMADVLEAQTRNIAGVYADRTGISADTWATRMQAETWYIGQQAVDVGLADRVVDIDQAGMPSGGNGNLDRVAARMVVLVNSDGTHTAMDGTHTHGAAGTHTHHGDANHTINNHGTGSRLDRAKAALLSAGFSEADTAGLLVAEGGKGAAGDGKGGALGSPASKGWYHRDQKCVFDPDGDGDNDATPEGDTDHDYFTSDGEQTKAIPDCPDHPGTGKPMPANALASTLFAATTADTSPWDAAKAWHAGANSDDPAAFYAGICAGRRSGDPSNQDSWALPYRYSPSSLPNEAGVRAALGRLSSTQGLTNSTQARSKLEGLMKKINPDYEPSDLDTSVIQSLLVSALEGGRR